jgi:drug/metabolite transporter (DMT)-like permease
VWVGLFAWLFMGKKNGRWYWVGLAVTLIGAALTVGFNSLGIGSVQFKGNMIALASGFTYAAYIIFTQRARRTMTAYRTSWLRCGRCDLVDVSLVAICSRAAATIYLIARWLSLHRLSPGCW